MNFAVIGGDMRNAKLSELLAADGHAVSVFAIDKLRLEGKITQGDTVKDTVSGADCVILPLPLTTRDESGILNTPLSNGLHTIHEAMSALQPEQIICAGKVDTAAAQLAAGYGLTLIDCLEREEFAVLNSVAAAEGAIQLIMEETSATLCGLNCLVIGFGRIGKVLCHRLRGLGVNVTASGRDVTDIAWIRAFCHDAFETANLDGKLGNFDVIVNTVPARVIDKQRLQELKDGCLILDLASKPGGLDFLTASKLGIKALWALSLPGDVAPVSSGAAIRETIYNILGERGRL